MSSRLTSLKKKIYRSRLTVSDNQPPAHAATTANASASTQIDTSNDVTMNGIQTSLAALQMGSAFAAKVPYIAPIAGLLLQILIMRDEVKQYKEEWRLVMRKLTRVGGIIVNVGEMCRKHNINEEDLPVTLLDILRSLQRELDEIERVLKMCSKKKGIKGVLLRKDLLIRIRQCDGELSNVLQAFQAGLTLEARFASIVERRDSEVTSNSGPIEPISTIPLVPNGEPTLFGISSKGALDALWSGMRNSLDGKEVVVGYDNFEPCWGQFGDINRITWKTCTALVFF